MTSRQTKVRLPLLLGMCLAAALTLVSPTPAFAAVVQDQANPGPGISSVGAFGDRRVAQVFRAGVTGQLTDLTLWACNLEDNLVTVDIGIYEASSSPPNATPPALPARSIGGASLSGTELAAIPDKSTCAAKQAFNVSLDSPAAIAAGDLYAFVVSTTTTSLPGGLGLSQSGLATYTDGNRAFSTDQGVTWETVSARNLFFITYVDVASGIDNEQLPKPVLQQFGKPTDGTCDEAQPADLNIGGAESGGWGESWAEWMNARTGGFVCTRTLVYSSALGHWVVG